MTINVTPNSLKSTLDFPTPNTLADAFTILGLGNLLLALPTTLRNQVPVSTSTNVAHLGTLQFIQLPDDAKACSIFRAYARTGTGSVGELTVEPYGTTPAAGQIAVAPNGDLVFLAADAWTNVDVVYLPEKYDLLDVTLPVSSNVLTLPASMTNKGVVLLLEANAVTATSPGEKIVLVPGGSPSAGQAALNAAKTTVTFASADAVTQAYVKVAVASAINVQGLLGAASTIL
jgi:hypothetical protein